LRKNRLLGAAAIVASIAGGGIAGALIGTPGVTAAQETTDTTTAPSDGGTDTTAPTEGGAEAPASEDERDPEQCFGRGGMVRPDLAVAAGALGISEDELKTALREGDSIAEVASERGVDVQTVLDALVADATSRIDEAVADGDLDADRAAQLKEALPERITAFVSGEGPRGPGHHGRGFGGPRGPRPDGHQQPAEDGSTAS
jgi:hypothetical protein